MIYNDLCKKKTIFELFLKEAIKTAERVKIASFTSPLPPSTERVKNKRMKYWKFETPRPIQRAVLALLERTYACFQS